MRVTATVAIDGRQPHPRAIAPRSFDGPSDASLAARLAVGDDQALAILYDRYSSLVFGLSRRVTASVAAAQEITQEVFVRLWQQPERFDPRRGTMRAFLGALAHRRAVDHVRRETRRRAREQREADDVSMHPADAELGTALERTEQAKRVREAVDALPPEQREAVMLAYFGGCTFREVAERLGVPEGTAKSRLRLALAKLTAMLSPERPGDGNGDRDG